MKSFMSSASTICALHLAAAFHCPFLSGPSPIIRVLPVAYFFRAAASAPRVTRMTIGFSTTRLWKSESVKSIVLRRDRHASIASRIVVFPLSPGPIKQFTPELGAQQSLLMLRKFSISRYRIFAIAEWSRSLRDRMLWIVSAVSRFRREQRLDAEPDHNHRNVFSTRATTPSAQDDTCRYGVNTAP